MLSREVFLFGLVCLQNALGLKKIVCSFDDEVCLLKTAQKPYDDVVAGVLSGISSDPLQLDVIELDLPTLKYNLNNAVLRGMADCKVMSVKFYRQHLNYTYGIKCPLFTTEAEYEVSGTIDSVPMEGKGSLKITHENCFVTYRGNYERMFNKNNKLQVRFTEFTLEFEPKGKVSYKYDNLFNGDIKKSDEFHAKFSKENWSTIDKVLGNATMNIFQHKFIENDNKYMQHVELEKFYNYYE